MPVSICPRCKHVNPDYANYCHFDGVVLQAQQSASVHRLPGEFKFPSGRRCNTFDELAQGCQEEWSAARDLLMRGVFAQYFRTAKRDDLVRAANDAKAQANPDIGLTTFLGALPGTRTATPKLDLNPRRILLGKVPVGDARTVPLTITNQGQGMLQGTVTVSEGQDWVSLNESKPFKLTIQTKGQAAGESYGARLTVVTNGGVVEVPLRMELVAQPFLKAPFQGAHTQRELAQKMRMAPKAAVPILESGEVQRWFAHNGWNYPVVGTPVKGVAAVQQFFEGMGVSKPPPLQLSKKELRLTCKYRDSARAQFTLQTPAKKWVYAHITSDSPWLKITTPQVSGPQHATVGLEIDTNLWNLGPLGEGKVTLAANGGEKLTLKVIVEVQGAPAGVQPKPVVPTPTPAPIPAATRAPAPTPTPTPTHTPAPSPIVLGEPPYRPTTASRNETPAVASSTGGGVKFIPALMTTILVCVALRLIMIPFVDMLGRPSVVASAADKLGVAPDSESDVAHFGGWLKLPWLTILSGADRTMKADLFQKDRQDEVSTQEFRHYFATYFIRWIMLRTWWIGAILGVIMVLRRGGGVLDVPWGIVAGTFAGLVVSATLAAFFLIGEMLPHTLYSLGIGAHGGIGLLLLWAVFAMICWLLLGIGLGIFVPWIAPLRRLLIDPFQSLLASAFSLFGLTALGAYWAPNA
jgi:hypothetical protein